MPPESVSSGGRARTASVDELKSLVRDALGQGDAEMLLALLANPHLDESHITLLLDRTDLPPTVLGAIASREKWASAEGVRFRLARHPRTPKSIALAALRQLYVFDLVRLSLMPSTPPDIQRAAEDVILNKAPHLPVGEKLTLARRGPARVAGALLAEGHPQAIKLALGNAFLSESQVLKVLATPGVPERVISGIARHPKWSCVYNVRAALVRNPHAPRASVQAFLPDLTLRDLQEIVALEGINSGIRQHIERELDRRSTARALSEVPGNK
jgi:hypothetical protein